MTDTLDIEYEQKKKDIGAKIDSLVADYNKQSAFLTNEFNKEKNRLEDILNKKLKRINDIDELADDTKRLFDTIHNGIKKKIEELKKQNRGGIEENE
jgi:hypothetical protein